VTLLKLMFAGRIRPVLDARFESSGCGPLFLIENSLYDDLTLREKQLARAGQ
jgi:hypothetical protein